MSRRVEYFVAVPKECMGLVIGKQGTNIKQLQQDTQTKINTKESGFTVTGSPRNCDAARRAIRHCVDNAVVTTNELVPHEFVHLSIRSDGDGNYRLIEGECGVKISWPRFSGTEEHVKFNIRGSTINCGRAVEMLRTNIEKWRKNNICHKDAPFVAAGSRNNSKHPKQKVKKEFPVPKEFLYIILGQRHKNKESIETKSKTKIKLQNPSEKEATLIITGQEQNCVRAISLIKSCIISHKEDRKREELGGNKRFVCLDYADEKSEFQLTEDKKTPKLDGFIRGPRYRIETEGDYSETEVSDKTILELEQHLLTSLNNLHDLKDEKELMIDLWCHFGKVFVHNVDEGEVRAITPDHVNRRMRKIVSPVKNTDKNSHWKVSFEEGVDPSDVNENALPKDGVENDDSVELINKLIHTQRRYDFGFTTPSARNVRLKAWEGLPSERNEPPDEVKNILRSIDFRDKKDIKALICYPSTTVLRGEILTPNSKYDCRMKLRAGCRKVSDKDMVCEEEDRILADYLLDCKFDDVAEYCMDLPDRELPAGFECTFYRQSDERHFSATVDGECYTVIVLDEDGWDSDSSTKRKQKQFGIRVVMNSWSKALLSPAREWETPKILGKLKDYMEFLSILKSDLFLSDDS